MPDVEELRYRGTPENPDIKIFVSHRIDQDSETIDNPLYVNVRCGAVYDERPGITMLGDDTGDNISDKRERLGEFTVQYWAWKNIKADYYGLCHYRRYLSFLFDKNLNIDRYTFIPEPLINQVSIDKHNLHYNTQGECIKATDIIYGRGFNVKNVPTPKGVATNTKEHLEGFDGRYIKREMIDLLIAEVKKHQPDYYDSLLAYLNSETWIGFNCYIMRSDYFKAMCEYQFNILLRLENKLRSEFYHDQLNRCCGYLGELLYGAFITKQKINSSCKIKEANILRFNYTQKNKPLSQNPKDDDVPIVFVASDFYVPYLYVCLKSLIRHTRSDKKYKVLVLNKNISEKNRRYLASLAKRNVSIQFYNPAYLLSGINLYTSHSAYAEEAFYRIFVPWILDDYEKCIILDSDIIINNDLMELYEIDISNKYIGAVKDYVYQGYINRISDIYDYTINFMNLEKPYDYVNTGVLVMNLSKIRQDFSLENIREIINEKRYKIQEQDVINVAFKNNIKFLDLSWNYFITLNKWIEDNIQYAPVKSRQEYEDISNIYIYHWANQPKPWNSPDLPYADLWWDYARKTPFYELILSRMVNSRIPRLPKPQIDSRSRMRKVFDGICPPNSRRRKLAKKIIPRDSVQWQLLRNVYLGTRKLATGKG